MTRETVSDVPPGEACTISLISRDGYGPEPLAPQPSSTAAEKMSTRRGTADQDSGLPASAR